MGPYTAIRWSSMARQMMNNCPARHYERFTTPLNTTVMWLIDVKGRAMLRRRHVAESAPLITASNRRRLYAHDSRMYSHINWAAACVVRALVLSHPTVSDPSFVLNNATTIRNRLNWMRLIRLFVKFNSAPITRM